MQNPSHKSLKSWIPVLLFWVLFAGSIILANRYSWIHTAWVDLLLIAIFAICVYSALHAFRREDGTLVQGGYPRWFLRFAHDEQLNDKNSN